MPESPRKRASLSMESKRKGAKTFTRFLELPTELQLMIWEFAAIPQPRLIELQGELRSLAEIQVERGNTEARESAVSFTWKVPAISILSTCRNARDIALPLYKAATYDLERNLVYNSVDLNPIYWPTGSILMDPSQDIFLYSPRTLREMMDIKRKFDTSMIKHLALSLDGKDLVSVGVEAFDNYLSLTLGGFHNLDTLELVLGRTKFAYPHYGKGQLIEIDVTPEGNSTSIFEDTTKHCGLEALSYMTAWARHLKKSYNLWKAQQPGPWQFLNTNKPSFNFKVSFMARKTTMPEAKGLWFVEHWQWTSESSTKSVGHKHYGNQRYGNWVSMPIARDVVDYRKSGEQKVLKMFNRGPQTSAEKELFTKFKDIGDEKEVRPKVDITRIMERLSTKGKSLTSPDVQDTDVPVEKVEEEMERPQLKTLNSRRKSKQGSERPKLEHSRSKEAKSEPQYPTTWTDLLLSGISMLAAEQTEGKASSPKADACQNDVSRKVSGKELQPAPSKSKIAEAFNSLDLNDPTASLNPKDFPEKEDAPKPKQPSSRSKKTHKKKDVCCKKTAHDLIQESQERILTQPKSQRTGSDPQVAGDSSMSWIDMVASSFLASLTMDDIQKLSSPKIDEPRSPRFKPQEEPISPKTKEGPRRQKPTTLSPEKEAAAREAAAIQIEEMKYRKAKLKLASIPRSMEELAEDLQRAAFARASEQMNNKIKSDDASPRSLSLSDKDLRRLINAKGKTAKELYPRSVEEIIEDIQRAASKETESPTYETLQTPKPAMAQRKSSLRPSNGKIRRMPSRIHSMDVELDESIARIDISRLAIPEAAEREALNQSITDTAVLRHSSRRSTYKDSPSSARAKSKESPTTSIDSPRSFRKASNARNSEDRKGEKRYSRHGEQWDIEGQQSPSTSYRSPKSGEGHKARGSSRSKNRARDGSMDVSTSYFPVPAVR